METKETNIEFLTSLTTLIWNLSENDIETTIEKTTILYDDNLDYSFKTVLCQILYESIKFQKKEVGIYFTYLKSIEKISEKTKNIFDFFGNFLSHQFSNLSIFLREIMIEQKLIDTKYISRDKRNTYYKFFKSVKKHSKYTNEFHRQLIKEGHNPNEIAKIIRNDEIEKLQEISSQSNFDYNQTIKPSLYERCSFINKNNVTLIDYAAFFSSIKCFKYLLMNGAKLDKTGKYAVAGGNEEIIHLCEQNHSSFLRAYETAIEYHRNDLFKYLYENKITKINHLKKLGKRCVSHHNYEILAFLQKEGLEINDYIINKAAEMGNIFLVKHFLINNPLPKDILFLASGSTNIELVKYILDTYQNEIDINYQYYDAGTAIISASSSDESADVLKLLLEQKGVDINAKDDYGWTALFRSCFDKCPAIIEILFEHGIDPNIKDYPNNFTVLNYCIRDGDTEIVKILLQHEGIEISSYDEQEAQKLLREKGNKEILELIQQYQKKQTES